MIYTTMTKRAMRIAYMAHKDQNDKANVPYIYHPIHLAEQMDTENAVIVALLHDVLEDTDWTAEQLVDQGFSEEIMKSLRLLKHDDTVNYLDYIRMIAKSNDENARKVKLADLRHNNDPTRFDHVDKRDLERFERYTQAIALLKGEREG